MCKRNNTDLCHLKGPKRDQTLSEIMMRRSKKSNRCFPPRRETSVHPPAWTFIGRQALWWVIMSRFLYQKESSLKYWIVIPQWEVDNDKLLPLIYLLVSPRAARRHICISSCWQKWFHLAKCLDLCQTLADQGFAFNFSLKMGSTISFSLEAKDKSLASDSPGKTKKMASPSSRRRVPSGEMPGARRPSWKAGKTLYLFLCPTKGVLSLGLDRGTAKIGRRHFQV